MRSPQTLSDDDRRRVAAWAADCAERVLGVFEAEVPGDDRPRQLVARARAFARGELSTAEEIRRQLDRMSAEVRAALQGLARVGENSSGPLGPGLLTSGELGAIVRELQVRLAQPGTSIGHRRQPQG